MTRFDQYRKEIIAAGKFLENNPDWEPGRGLLGQINTLDPGLAIGYMVEELTWD